MRPTLAVCLLCCVGSAVSGESFCFCYSFAVERERESLQPAADRTPHARASKARCRCFGIIYSALQRAILFFVFIIVMWFHL